MPTALATGQVTIIDYNDALGLSGYLGINLATKVQVYNPDNNSYYPDWSTTNLIISPSLFIQGNGADISKSANVTKIEWFDAEAPTVKLATNTDYTVPATFVAANGHPLTIKKNILTNNISAKTFICEITYKDPTTQLELLHKSTIDLSRVVNGGGLVSVIVSAPSGNVFKNDISLTLPLTAELWRGGVKDTELVQYRWYIQNGSTDDGIGGPGWEYITTANAYLITGFGTATINVPNAAVTNIETFKCVIKDIDPASNTKDSYFSSTIVLIDQTDPLTCDVLSSGGDVFKNGTGTSTLTAVVKQNGVIVDEAGTKYQYEWTKYNNEGVIDTEWKTNGKTITANNVLPITGADVSIKGTFSCSIFSK